MHYIEPDGMMMHLDQSTEPYDDREEMPPMPNTPQVTPMWAVETEDPPKLMAYSDKEHAKHVLKYAEAMKRGKLVAGVFVPLPVADARVGAAMKAYGSVIQSWIDARDDDREIEEVDALAMRAAPNAVLTPEGK